MIIAFSIIRKINGISARRIEWKLSCFTKPQKSFTFVDEILERSSWPFSPNTMSANNDASSVDYARTPLECVLNSPFS